MKTGTIAGESRRARRLGGALFFVAGLFSVGASATFVTTETNLGPLGIGDSASIGGSSHVFFVGGGTDYYHFDLIEEADVVVDINVESSEWVLASAKGRILGESGSGTSFTVTDLQPDDYTLKVKYVGFKIGSGSVGYNGSVAVVPLPAAAWLFASALAGLLFASRRQAAPPLGGALAA